MVNKTQEETVKNDEKRRKFTFEDAQDKIYGGIAAENW